MSVKYSDKKKSRNQEKYLKIAEIAGIIERKIKIDNFRGQRVSFLFFLSTQ